MIRSLPISLLVTTAIMAVATPAANAAGNGTGKTMAAEVLASALGQAGGANFVLADGSVRFLS